MNIQDINLMSSSLSNEQIQMIMIYLSQVKPTMLSQVSLAHPNKNEGLIPYYLSEIIKEEPNMNLKKGSSESLPNYIAELTVKGEILDQDKQDCLPTIKNVPMESQALSFGTKQVSFLSLLRELPLTGEAHSSFPIVGALLKNDDIKSEEDSSPAMKSLQTLHKVKVEEDANKSRTASIRFIDHPLEEHRSSSSKHKKLIKQQKEMEEFLEGEQDEEIRSDNDEPQDEVFKPTKHVYYLAKHTIKEKRILPKRALIKEVSENIIMQSNQMELVFMIASQLEPILGYQEIDQEKIFSILKKSEMDPKKVITKVKRNLNYYKSALKLK